MTSSPLAPPTSLYLRKIQRTRKLILLGAFGSALVPLLFIKSYWHWRASPLYIFIEWIGVALIVCCIVGRTWCALYIAGRKRRTLVTIGPYSVVRNPLYVFTLLGVFGSGAQTGSLLVSAVITLIVFVVFYRVVRIEEEFLRGNFPEFAAYASRVPRFLPRVAGWTDIDELLISPRFVRRTFVDACIFLAAIPGADILDKLQTNNLVPILFFLP